jgi:uncharacterized protein
MRNPHGWPIWYELMTADSEASKAFYDGLFGWTIGPKPEGMDYRMIDTPEGQVGGVLVLTDEMKAEGARPGWLFYVGVEDVDTTVAEAEKAGGKVVVPPTDIPDVGRFAMLTDPAGAPFYVMRGIPDEASTAYQRMGMHKCSWHELTTTDQAGANAFYATLFGWTYPDKMSMGPLGDYVFVQTAGEIVGATMPKPDANAPEGWRFYFRVPDIDAAAETVRAGGGTVFMEPMEVPGGEWIIVAADPHGAVFGAVAPSRES